MIELLAAGGGTVVLLLGLALASIGLVGMLRRPSLFEQLHAAGLVTGPGVILVLLAALASGRAETATSGTLVIVFILVTASLSTHAVALVAWRLRGTRAPGRTVEAGGPMRVLLAHDGSPGAAVAVELARSLPWPAGSMLRLVAVVGPDLPPLDEGDARRAEPAAGPDLATAVDAAAAGLRRPHLAVDTVLRRGDPAIAIATEAASMDAGLVLVGSRSLGAVRTALEGSVAAAVVDAATCPVLVVRRPTLRGLLLAVDGSTTSEAAVDAVARWPIFEAVPVRVLSVATGGPAPGRRRRGTLEEGLETARRQKVADEVALRLRTGRRRVSAEAQSGDPAARILALHPSDGIDLVVVGSRGQTGWRRLLLGSVARAVLASADTSVLVVKASDPTSSGPGAAASAVALTGRMED